eukprot:7124058-Karenia_brevis.AAC.1
MGFSWALHICQLIINNTMCQVVGQNCIVEDKRGGICLHHEDDAFGAAYVDNCAIGSGSPEVCDRLLKTAVDKFTDMGFIVHEISPAATRTEFLGLELDDS